ATRPDVPLLRRDLLLAEIHFKGAHRALAHHRLVHLGRRERGSWLEVGLDQLDLREARDSRICLLDGFEFDPFAVLRDRALRRAGDKRRYTSEAQQYQGPARRIDWF